MNDFRNGTSNRGALWCGRFAAVAALLVLGLLFSASGAKAGCGLPYKAGAAPFVTPHEQDDSWGGDPDGRTIVGLWHLNYTGTYDNNFPPGHAAPTPFPFLESYKTWHADGTEFENAFLPPTGGNICFGVWKDLGHGTVKLHHIGLMFDSTGAVSNVFTVDEIDTVSPSGRTYSGTFDFKLFGAADVYGTGTPISEVKGTTSGTRIEVD